MHEREIFEASLKHPERERERFLQEACVGDSVLVERVRLLLDAHQRAQRDASTVEIPAAAADDPERIGPYRILERIGEGGMGVVYLSEQTRPVARYVALKLIKLGMDTEEVIARFESERQALALMNHANIARMLDAGATGDGRPYFVMEHVQGTPITAYCDEHRLSIDERLELFVQVCEGVQHAHQKGVIHRDLKASNVLVAVEGDRPVPKIIDFGISKAIQRPLIEKTLFTRLGAIMGTPEYMSPEQAELSPLDIDTRTDVYSLGALLYSMLAGALPFNTAELTLDEIRRRIREVEPPKPSIRLQTLGAAAAGVARRRESDPTTLARRLRGDLDWITMKALEKDRARRYSSASELAADVQRHLDSEPVLAGPPGVGYRLGKFARRNRGQLVAAAAILLVLVGGIIGTNVGLVRARAEAERSRTQAAIAEAVNTFLNEDLLAAPAPQRRGINVSMREVLAAASERIEGRFSDEPLVEAAIRRTIGQTYVSLGAYPTAEPHLVRAVQLYRQTVAAPTEVEAAALGSLAGLYFLQERYEESERTYLEAVELRSPAAGATDSTTLVHMHNLGAVYTRLGRHEEAEALLDQTFATRLEVLGENHSQTLATMVALANLYWYMARYEDAARLYGDAVEARRRVFGREHPETLLAMNNLGMLYTWIGRRAEAETLLIQTADGRRRVLGDGHPQTATTLINLGNVYWEEGRPEAAGPLYAEALEARRRTFGPEHPGTLSAMSNLGLIYLETGRLEDGEALLRETLEIRTRVLGKDDPVTLSNQHNLAAAYFDQERYEEARELFSATLEATRRVEGEAAGSTLLTAAFLAEVFNVLDQHATARTLAEQTLERASNDGAQLPWEAATCSTQLGVALAGLGDYERAEEVLLDAQASLETSHVADESAKSDAIRALAELYDEQGRDDEAQRWRDRLPAPERRTG